MLTVRLRSALLLAPILLIAGCINYEQKTQLNADGSGTMNIHYWAAEDAAQWFGTNDKFSFTEGEVKQQYVADGVTVERVTVESNPADSTRHVRVELAFKDIRKLGGAGNFKDVSFSLVPKGGDLVFTQKMHPGDSNKGGSFGMENYTFTYVYTFPNDVVSSNAHTVDGRTLTWKYKLSDLQNDMMLTATFKAGSPARGWMFVVIAGVVVAMGAMIVAIARKRRRLQEGGPVA